MHVGNSAKTAFEGGGKNDDWHLRPFLAQRIGNLGPKLALSKVVVQNRNINVTQLRFGVFDRSAGYDLVSPLPQDHRAKDEVLLAVVQQENADRLGSGVD